MVYRGLYLTDRGAQFESALWKSVMERLGTRVQLGQHILSSNQWINRKRMNRTLIVMIEERFV